MAFNFKKTAKDTIRYVVVDGGINNNAYKLVEVQGKKRALRAAGLPGDMVAAQPAESRWGQVITLEEAKQILKEQGRI